MKEPGSVDDRAPAADPGPYIGTWTYPWAFTDRGHRRAAEDLRSAGFASVSVSTVYHGIAAVRPFASKRFWFTSDATCYFPVPEELGEIQPTATQDDLVAPVADAVRGAGLSLTSWVVFLHTTDAARYPDLAVRSIDGDPHPEGLCPSQPANQEFVFRLAETVDARYGPDVMDVETIGWTRPHSIHPKVGLVVTPVLAYLLAICWCRACLAAAPPGLPAALRRRARQEITRRTPPMGVEEFLASDPDLWAFQDAREATVAGLAAGIRSRVRARIHVVDEVAPYADGQSLARLAGDADRFVVSIPASVSDIRGQLEEAAAIVSQERVVAGVPILAPDVASRDQLAGMLEAVRSAGVTSLSIYNAGLVGEERLGWCADLLPDWTGRR
jgi:hypothetical protein